MERPDLAEYREAILAQTSYDFKPGELRRCYDRGESIEDVIADAEAEIDDALFDPDLQDEKPGERHTCHTDPMSTCWACKHEEGL